MNLKSFITLLLITFFIQLYAHSDSLAIIEFSNDLELLQTKIEYHESSKAEFLNIIKTQTAIFSLIVTVALLIIGYFSYFGFKREVELYKENLTQELNSRIENIQIKFKNLEKDVKKDQLLIHEQIESANSSLNLNQKEIIEKYETMNKSLDESQLKIALSSANSLLSIGNFYLSSHQVDLYIFYYLLTAKEHLIATNLRKKLHEISNSNHNQIKNILKSIYINLNRLIEITDPQSVLTSNEKTIFNILNDLFQLENEEIKSFCMKIRSEIIKTNNRVKT